MRYPRRLLQRRRLIVSTIVLAATFSSAHISQADPGDLDPTFGTGGVAILPVGTHSYCNAIAIQSDDKIVLACYVLSGTGDMAAVRVDASGVLDPAFGTGGVVTLPAGTQSLAYAIAIQADGKILVGGGYVVSESLDYDFRLARLLPADGALDSGFGTGGIAEAVASATQPGINALVVQPDGKILAGGEGKPDVTSPKTNRDFLVVRWLDDGTLDGGFGNGGRATVSMGKRYDSVQSLLLEPGGAIVASGYSAQASGARAGLARLSSAGALDGSFGRNGRQRLRLGGKVSYGVDAQFLSDGRILIAGLFVEKGDLLPTAGLSLGVFTADGLRDDSFGDRGVATAAPDPAAYYHPTNIAVQSDGKIVVVGGVNQGAGTDSTSDVLVARFLDDGTLDAGFGDGGIVRAALSAQDEALGVALDGDGNIVVTGVSVIGTQSRIFVARYLP
jgi:uncharacterized delta-60 repeat protein